MKLLEIQGLSGHSDILVGESLDNLDKYTQNKRTIIITDRIVASYYRPRFPKADVIEIGCSEEVKKLETVESIYKQLLDLEVDRSCFIVGIGGGVVCDIAGFVASTYMRGLPFGFVSSSLLSQVDASVGGKNGVNFYGYKNIIGIFQQPLFVICDLTMFNTLPSDQLANGLAEVIKHAAIADKDHFNFLEKNYEAIISLDMQVLEKLVYDSISIKAAVVVKDEREKGERRKLNFGHTFGHAVETSLCIPHGEAVSIGMVLAAHLSVQRGYLEPGDAQRLKALLDNVDLPTSIMVDKQNIRDAIKRDKKREGEGIHFVLLKGLGQAVIEEISIQELEGAVDDLFKCR